LLFPLKNVTVAPYCFTAACVAVSDASAYGVVLYPNRAMLTVEPAADDEAPAAGDELDGLEELDELHAATTSVPASTATHDLVTFDTCEPAFRTTAS
jgi:hypothetical protein